MSLPSFRISALPAANFRHLFDLSDGELTSIRAVRVTANRTPGFPCRVSLADAEVGEELILTHHEHHAVDTPFRASHAVYVRKNAAQAYPEVDEVPDLLRSRTLSLRGFNAAGMLVAADLAEGAALKTGLHSMLADAQVAYIHIHFAKPGCYAARADRASGSQRCVQEIAEQANKSPEVA
jgi:hypothetical protein